MFCHSPRIVCFHQRASDQKGICLAVLEQPDVRVGQYSALCDKYLILWIHLSNADRIVQRDRKILQIPVIDTVDLRFLLLCLLYVMLVMGLYQRIHAKLCGKLIKSFHLLIIQNRCDQ